MNGCHNRPPYRESQPVQDGHYMDGVTRYPKMVPLRFVMKTDCQYTHTALGRVDQGCAECIWKSKAAPQQPATQGASK